MFNLESSITNWREKMFAAGISVAALNELESHLREEVAQQIRAGSDPSHAFKIAAAKIGPVNEVWREFKKVEGAGKTGWSILLLIGWLAASFVLWYGVLGFAIGWDMFSFQPRWNSEIAIVWTMILTAEAGIWILARVSRDRVTRISSLLICLSLAAVGFLEFYPPDAPTRPDLFTLILFGDRPSPFWFRSGLTLLLCIPLTIWGSWEWRRAYMRNLAQDKPALN